MLNTLYTEYHLCQQEYLFLMNKLTQDEFIKRANFVHGNRYNYSKAIYQTAQKKVIIICPDHGEFTQRPHDHVKGKNGCPTCKFDKLAFSKRKTLKQFIKEAEQLHRNKYNYSKVVYKNAHTKISIICSIHGEFFQTPDKHLSGAICPVCSHNTSKGEVLLANIFYDNKIEYETQKIFKDCYGCSSRSKFRFDFYLPEYNTLVEFDGPQHFVPVRSIRAKLFTQDEAIRNFLLLKEKDHLKNEYALQNQIKLIRIPYFASKKSIRNYYLYDILKRALEKSR